MYGIVFFGYKIMHKLNLSDSTSTEKTPGSTPTDSQPVVDEQATLGQNQSSDVHEVDHSGSDITTEPTLRSMDLKPTKIKDMTKKSPKILIIISLLAILAGTATGYGGYKLNAGPGGPMSRDNAEPLQQVAGENVKAGDIFGIQDPDTFKDSAEGYLEEGSSDGEGSHQLLREGGISQTVVLTSSATDLDKLIGMEVKVWGETFKAQKAGWLMDVGRVEIVNPDGEAPLEE